MALTVQTNNAAITALKHLNNNNISMNRALERLSSGFRINSAADDASGYAISSKLNAQGERLKAAVQNGLQATAMVKMADAAVNEIQNMTVRIQTLAIQGSSANNTAEANKLDAERLKLEGQINKIANGTNYNGVNLLNGVDSSLSTTAVAATGATLANGANTGFSAVTGTSNIFENATFAITTTAGTAAAGGTLTGGAAVSASVSAVDVAAGSLATAGANGDYFLSNAAGVITVYSGTDATGAVLGSVDLSAVGAATTNVVLANGVSLDFTTTANVADTATAATTLAGASAATGGTVTSVQSTTDLVDQFGNTIAAAGTNLLAATQDRAVAGGALTLNLTASAGGTSGSITVTDAAAASQLAGVSGVTTTGATAGSSVSYTAALNFQVGDANNSNHQVGINLQNSYTTASLGLSGVAGNLLTAAGSAAYIDTAVAAIDTLTNQRADLGATQNQLAFVNSNLATAIEQVSSAVSSIRDADMAAEMTDFTKSQILVQAGTSMLAQANQASQNVLSLFR